MRQPGMAAPVVPPLTNGVGRAARVPNVLARETASSQPAPRIPCTAEAPNILAGEGSIGIAPQQGWRQGIKGRS